MSIARSETPGLRGAAVRAGIAIAAVENDSFMRASTSEAVDTGLLLSSSSARSANATANRLDAQGGRKARRSRRGVSCRRDSFGTC
eukprot:9483577-Pyramimonas_sp.AAC.1